MQLICQVCKETAHCAQNYDLLGNMSPHAVRDVYDVISGSMETQYFISVVLLEVIP